MAQANNSTHKQNSEDNILTTTIRLKIASMWPLSWFQGMFEGWAVSDMLTFFFLKKVSRKKYFLSQKNICVQVLYLLLWVWINAGASAASSSLLDMTTEHPLTQVSCDWRRVGHVTPVLAPDWSLAAVQAGVYRGPPVHPLRRERDLHHRGHILCNLHGR